jgi:hypothetical protein
MVHIVDDPRKVESAYAHQYENANDPPFPDLVRGRRFNFRRRGATDVK